MPWQSEPLREDHVLEGFCCGQDDLDRWLKEFARHAAKLRTAITFVWADDKRVVAYYALCAHQVRRDELATRRLLRGQPALIPATLVAKLALDQGLRGQDLGEQLLVDALQRILVASAEVAARLVVVEAVNGDVAGKFYERFGFVRTEPGGTRLVRPIADIAKDLEV